MLKTICSSIVIFSAMSVPISTAQDIDRNSPYVMEQTEGNEIYRPLFYTAEVQDPAQDTESRNLEYNHLLFTEGSEHPDVFVNNDRNIITQIWSEYWSEIERMSIFDLIVPSKDTQNNNEK